MDIFGSFPGSLGQDNPKPSLPVQRSRRRYGIRPRETGLRYLKPAGRSVNNSNWKVEELLAGSWRGATSVLISSGRDHVVVDTGMPHEAHLLVKALQGKGIQPEDVQSVINTHFHFDHVLNGSLFGRSLIYATQQSFDWCRSLYSDLADGENWEKLVLKYYPETFQHEGARERMAKLRKLALRWWDAKRLGRPEQFRWMETHALPEGLESFVTSGHVPGHVSLIVRTGEKVTVVAGDALLSGRDEEQVATMIPHSKEQFRLDRARLLSLGERILPGHDREFTVVRG
jgi:glyoxylase-like metal-dependent hydrolase (beta-lactamase superfamily II)